MSWDEFRALLCGISPDTPLGRIVSIRAEEDKDVLKNFSKEQNRIRDEWRQRKAEHMDMATYEQAMKTLEAMFAAMCS